jgi:preprotein translocase subunit SecE
VGLRVSSGMLSKPAFLSRIVWNLMATSEVQTVNSSADKAKLAAAVVLLVAGFVGFYLLASRGAAAQWGALIAGMVAAAVVFVLSESGRQLIAFGRDAWRETKKVVWPARREAIQMTAYVFAFVFVMALFLWLTDKTLEWLFYDVILGWRK